jgi:hypothetical protein
LLTLRREEGQEIDAKDVGPHVEEDERERKRHGDKEASGEIDEFGVAPMIVLGRHAHGLERHAADRTMSRPFLHDLGMHGAGVKRALGKGLGLALLVEIALGLLGKFDAAAVRAEMIGLALVLVARLAGVRVHHHPADGIGSHVGLAQTGFVHVCRSTGLETYTR